MGNLFGTAVPGSPAPGSEVLGEPCNANLNEDRGPATAIVEDACRQRSDCNANDVHDSCDLAAMTSDDVNVNAVPDECEEITLLATPGGWSWTPIAGAVGYDYIRGDLGVLAATAESRLRASPVPDRKRRKDGPFAKRPP